MICLTLQWIYFRSAQPNLLRRFLIMSYGSCDGDHGWLNVVDAGTVEGAPGSCPQESTPFPKFFYTTSGYEQLYFHGECQ